MSEWHTDNGYATRDDAVQQAKSFRDRNAPVTVRIRHSPQPWGKGKWLVQWSNKKE